MIYEFQVLYRRAADGPLDDKIVRAEASDQARTLIEAAAGVSVVSVGPGRPVMSPGKVTFSREEAAVYLDVSESKIAELQAKGELPRPQRNGHSVFRIDELETYRARAMNLELWRLADFDRGGAK